MSNLTAELLSLRARVSALEAADAGLMGENSADAWWMLSNGILVFFMQCGFGMLEAGSVTARATQNILLKNLLDTSVSAIVWWSVGHGIAYDGDNGFIGVASGEYSLFFAARMQHEDANGWSTAQSASGGDWAFWWFQFTFAAAAATIVSGAVAERTRLLAYLLYSSVITIFIYPVVAHWVWSRHGFLSTANPDALFSGSVDFAGSGVVHLTGGVAALCGAKIIGPRPGKFVFSNRVDGKQPRCCDRRGCCASSGNALPMPGHSSVLQALGTFILWMGWYGFNAGSTLRIGGDAVTIAARIFVTTTLSASTAGITAVLLERFRGHARAWDVQSMCNGVLAGLVAMSGGCATVPVWAAVVTGFVAGVCYRTASHLVVEILMVDDPLDAFAVHGANGAWGVLACGLFSADYYVQQVVRDAGASGGVLFGGGDIVSAGLIQIGCTVVWSGSLSLIMFQSLKLLGVLRVSASDLVGGATVLDGSRHLGAPYIAGEETKPPGVPSVPMPQAADSGCDSVHGEACTSAGSTASQLSQTQP